MHKHKPQNIRRRIAEVPPKEGPKGPINKTRTLGRSLFREKVVFSAFFRPGWGGTQMEDPARPGARLRTAPEHDTVVILAN